MTRENNFLIGNGQALTKPEKVPSVNRGKDSPYTMLEAKERLSDQLIGVQDFNLQLPDAAKPKNQVVVKLTMHPRYVSKNDYPRELLELLGLRSLGSKSEKITPQRWGIKKPPESAITESYFIAGLESQFDKWLDLLDKDDVIKSFEKLGTIEKLSNISAQDKFKGQVIVDQNYFEVVLHNDNDPEILDLFLEYAKSIGGESQLNKIRSVDSLTFVPLIAESPQILNQISNFSFVRATRCMPSIRPLNPMVRNSARIGSSLILPSGIALDQSIKTVIFDGGLENPSALEKWVNYIEPDGIGKPNQDYLDHGLAVTGSYLFGHIDKSSSLPTPVSKVDHVRVLDENTGYINYDAVDVLDRITTHLKQQDYDLVNISLGPNISVDDDEVTLWTASLDKIFANGNCLATVAVGNNGESDAASGLHRIQVPSDGVNVLSVGASDSTGIDWNRADYSAYGPGRCPGRAKPDFITFGGSRKQPFETLCHDKTGFQTAANAGTSFAAPMALRSIAGLKSTLGAGVSNLSLKALMIHHADRKNYKLHEVGWGRAELDPLRLITSEDYEATVLYQGELLVGQHLRIPLPMRDLVLRGEIQVKATLVISPEVDIEYPGAYTRHGIEAVFRPHDNKFTINSDTGKRSEHPSPATFFTKSDLFKEAEYINRKEGNKWEPTLKHNDKFKAENLSNPVFDVYYNYREGADIAKEQKPIPYSMLITISARDVPDLYNQVIRNYANILNSLKPQNRIQL